MYSKRVVDLSRWLVAALALACIVTFFRVLLRANPTTVALGLLLFILFLATRWGLRYAVATSFAAGACYNYFFLPPFGRFTVSDPQNMVALFVFLITSIVASRLSNRIRQESQDARARQAELEILHRVGRALLQTEELVQLTNSVTAAVAHATGADAVQLYLLEGDRIFRSRGDVTLTLSTDQLREISQNPGILSIAQQVIVPLRSGAKPGGALILDGTELSLPSLEALGGLISIALDRSSAIAELTRAEAAKESERLRSLMLDSITHELRTPLTSIKASVSTLLSSVLRPEVTHDLLTVIDEESDRLNRLVSQAVEMAQLDTHEIRMAFRPQTLRTLIEDALETSRIVLQRHPVEVSLPLNLAHVSADPVWVAKLLGNLLENAAKYSEGGQPIFISARQNGPFVACSVTDRGPGVDPAEQPLIFDKFYRARNQTISGTGMGLAISRAIVEAHGGAISVTSQPGHGSAFTFTLPSASGDAIR